MKKPTPMIRKYEGESLFLNPYTKEMKAFDSIVFQKRDGNYISDAYRNDIDIVARAITGLAELKYFLDPNTLCRICGTKGYEILDILKTNETIRRLLEEEE